MSIESMHHAHYADGSGWCPYVEITLAMQRLRWGQHSTGHLRNGMCSRCHSRTQVVCGIEDPCKACLVLVVWPY